MELLRSWTERLQLPRLRPFGVTAGDVDRIVQGCRGGSMRTNPLVLDDAELAELLYT